MYFLNYLLNDNFLLWSTSQCELLTKKWVYLLWCNFILGLNCIFL